MVVHTYFRPIPYGYYSSDSDGSVSSGEFVFHGSSSPVKCRWEECGEWLSGLESLATHVSSTHAVVGTGGLFYCGWQDCPRGSRGFNARYKMLVHVRTHTNEKPHQCYQCGKSFSRAENLKIHARSHTGERPYVCPVTGCGKAYSNSSDRFKHTRTHSEDKPYICKVPGCPKRYTDPSSLRKHVKTYRHFTQSSSGGLSVSPPVLPNIFQTGGILKMETEDETEQRTDERRTDYQVEDPAVVSSAVPEEDRQQSADSTERRPRAWSTIVRWWGDLSAVQETPLDLTSPFKIHHQAES